MKVRFFAGYDLENSNLDDLSLIQDAYARSIPMGGTLNIEANKNPTFLVWAIADPARSTTAKNSNYQRMVRRRRAQRKSF